MNLRERLGAPQAEFVVRTEVPQEQAQSSRSYQATKTHIHQVLLERIDLEAMENLAPERLKEELRLMVERLLLEDNLVLNAGERRNLVRDIQYEMLGLGPLELKLVMILMACPAAIVSYTMALEMKGDETIASGAIVLSVVTSLVTLAVIVGAF